MTCVIIFIGKFSRDHLSDPAFFVYRRVQSEKSDKNKKISGRRTQLSLIAFRRLGFFFWFFVSDRLIFSIFLLRPGFGTCSLLTGNERQGLPQGQPLFCQVEKTIET